MSATRKTPTEGVYAAILGRRIKRARQRKKISQQELAGKSGVPYTSLNDIERGEVTPRVDKVQRIAKALGVKVDSLMPPAGASSGGAKNPIPRKKRA